MPASVSVVIPSYNYALFIAAAINSALAQTHAPHEVIVVDDGSTDHTLGILEGFGTRIRVIRQKNAGVGAARNTGAHAATGEFLAFLDSDDEWLPTKLERQLALATADPSLGLIHCGMVETDASGHVLRTLVDGLDGWVARDMLLFERMAIVAPGSTLLLPRRVFLESGGFDPRCPPSEDWDLAFKVARRYRVGFVREPLLRYRHHGGGGHLNIARMERGMLVAFATAFAEHDPELSPLRRRAYGNLHKILAGSYFRAGDYRQFVRHAARSLAMTPENFAHFGAFPLRWLRRRIT